MSASAPKGNSLLASVQSRIGRDDPPKEPARAKEKAAGGAKLPPSRAGKKALTIHAPPNVVRHLKIVAAEEGATVESLVLEALDLLFVKKGRELIDGKRR